jgi:hypothetical protein
VSGAPPHFPKSGCKLSAERRKIRSVKHKQVESFNAARKSRISGTIMGRMRDPLGSKIAVIVCL